MTQPAKPSRCIDCHEPTQRDPKALRCWPCDDRARRASARARRALRKSATTSGDRP